MGMNLCYSSLMRPNQHEKNEWSRMAQAAYAANRNDVGHRYSCAASLPWEGTISIDLFDSLQRGYRNWLAFGEWPVVVRS